MLAQAGWKELDGYGVRRVRGEAVDAARTGAGYTVSLSGGTALTARRLVVATGLTDQLPNIPGVAERWGRDVLHCPYCHGYEVRQQPLAVLGTHPQAIHHALLLRQWSGDVAYLTHDFPPDEDQELELRARAVDVIQGTITGLLVDGDKLRGIKLEGGEIVERSVVFLFPTMVPNDTLLTQLGCACDERGWVTTDRTGRTSDPGVWAVGNVTDPRAQVITAAGAGSAAAFAINTDLVISEVREAVSGRPRPR